MWDAYGLLVVYIAFLPLGADLNTAIYRAIAADETPLLCEAAIAQTQISMAQTRDWQGMKVMSARLLKERTGEDVDIWNQRIKIERFNDVQELRAWLTAHGVAEGDHRDALRYGIY